MHITSKIEISILEKNTSHNFSFFYQDAIEQSKLKRKKKKDKRKKQQS